jgi:hypothetical protein
MASTHVSFAFALAALCGACGDDAPPATTPDAGPPRVDAGPPPGLMPVTLPSCASNDDAFPVRPAITAPATLPPLHVEGRRVLDPDGRDVALRGTNFGAWMQAESWLSAYGRQPGPTDCTNTHAPCFHDLLVSDWEREADRLGVRANFDRARARTALAWELLSEPRWPMVQSWRERAWMAAEGRESEVTALWAYIDDSPWVFEEESLWALLARRFGPERAARLCDVHQENFILEIDAERVAALGLNVVRVPFWYANLEEETPAGVRYRAEGFARLDAVARWARTHGLYVILDMHGAPGGQSQYDHQGLRNGGSLWTRPECEARGARLWGALASYFQGDPHVVAYDLLNEPNPEDVDAYARVHTAFYAAIRAVDAEKIVVLEDGYQGEDGVRSPGELGFTQTIWEIHEYPEWTNPEDFAARMVGSSERWIALAERFDVPIYMGEFSPEATGPDGSPEALPARVEAMDRAIAGLAARGVHWTTWTWKTGGRADSTWGLYHPTSDRWVDLTTQDADAIERAFVSMRSDDWLAIPALEASLRARAADPVTYPGAP